MIGKDYVNFYKNWYYKKEGDFYTARERGEIGIITEIPKEKVAEFVKKLSKVAQLDSGNFSQENLLIVCQKYHWIKPYHKEIVMKNIKKAIVFCLFVSAINCGDENLCNYILTTYNLTEEHSKSWVIETLPLFDSVKILEIKNGKTYYSLRNNGRVGSITFAYSKGDDFCVCGKTRYRLSQELKQKINEVTDKYYVDLYDALNKTNGFSLVDFQNERFVAYKNFGGGKYHFVAIKKFEDEFSFVYQTEISAIEFLLSFDFVRWGISAVPNSEILSLEKDAMPLILSVKDGGDKFLEYEIKYLLNTATEQELDYLNQNDSVEHLVEGEKRFYLKKEIYDVEDVEILSATSRLVRWLGRVRKCEIIIDGGKRKAYFLPSKDFGKNELSVVALFRRLKCKITDRLADKIHKMMEEK